MNYPFDSISNFIFAETIIEPADIILIPGSNQKELMLKAAELYHKGIAPLILPSGGCPSKVPPWPSEWEYLRHIGLSLGISDSAILKENLATNTFENALYSMQALLENGLNPKKVIMVCKNYHSRRALLTYQTEFPKETEFLIAPIVDDTGITKENWFLDRVKINIVMQEVVKIGQYFAEEIEGLYEKFTT